MTHTMTTTLMSQAVGACDEILAKDNIDTV